MSLAQLQVVASDHLVRALLGIPGADGDLADVVAVADTVPRRDEPAHLRARDVVCYLGAGRVESGHGWCWATAYACAARAVAEAAADGAPPERCRAVAVRVAADWDRLAPGAAGPDDRAMYAAARAVLAAHDVLPGLPGPPLPTVRPHLARYRELVDRMVAAEEAAAAAARARRELGRGRVGFAAGPVGSPDAAPAPSSGRARSRPARSGRAAGGETSSERASARVAARAEAWQERRDVERDARLRALLARRRDDRDRLELERRAAQRELDAATARLRDGYAFDLFTHTAERRELTARVERAQRELADVDRAVANAAAASGTWTGS